MSQEKSRMSGRISETKKVEKKHPQVQVRMEEKEEV